MIINEYLARKGMTQKEFADLIGLSRCVLNGVLNGRKRLNPEYAIKVFNVTKGQVTRDEAIFPEFYDWKI